MEEKKKCCAQIGHSRYATCGKTARYGVDGRFCKTHAKKLHYADTQIREILRDDYRRRGDKVQESVRASIRLNRALEDARAFRRQYREAEAEADKLTAEIEEKRLALQNAPFIPTEE